MVVHARGLHLRGRGIKVALKFESSLIQISQSGLYGKTWYQKASYAHTQYTTTVLHLARRCEY